MVSVREVPADRFLEKLKERLKGVKEISPPPWAAFVKSGVHRERPPEQPDFWYVRSAAILRRIYLDNPIGVERLRSYFGGRKRRGRKPTRFRKASGAIIRKILQQLEAAGFVEKGKGGRLITPKGQSFLDGVAYEVSKEKG